MENGIDPLQIAVCHFNQEGIEVARDSMKRQLIISLYSDWYITSLNTKNGFSASILSSSLLFIGLVSSLPGLSYNVIIVSHYRHSVTIFSIN